MTRGQLRAARRRTNRSAAKRIAPIPRHPKAAKPIASMDQHPITESPSPEVVAVRHHATGLAAWPCWSKPDWNDPISRSYRTLTGTE
jgi:hypothetical protein